VTDTGHVIRHWVASDMAQTVAQALDGNVRTPGPSQDDYDGDVSAVLLKVCFPNGILT